MQTGINHAVSHFNTGLSAQELAYVSGGKMIIPVTVGGRPGYTVDWDAVLMDIFTGRIGVTVK